MGAVAEVVSCGHDVMDRFPGSLHGRDPRTGLTGTWHIERDPLTGQCRVEWALGSIAGEEAWRRARKVTTLLSDNAVRSLVVRVTGR